MTVTLRPAVESDSRFLWEWRNDPVSRAASLDTSHVGWEDHERWFSASLTNPARRILIGVDESTRVGMVRFDLTGDGSTTVSINVAPDRRGRGTGQNLLHSAIDQVSAERLVAQIRVDNTASIRIFEREGFVRTAESEGVLTLVRDAAAS